MHPLIKRQFSFMILDDVINKEKTDVLWYCRLVFRYPEFFYVVSNRPTTSDSYWN